jgi:hypothetical protein
MILTFSRGVLAWGARAMTRAQLEARSRRFLLGLRETQKRQLRDHRQIARLNRLVEPGERIEPDVERRRFTMQAIALTAPSAVENAPLEELLQIMEHLRDLALRLVKKRTLH